MNKTALKNLKKAMKDYKKKVQQPVVIEFQEPHINVLVRALEFYQRFKMGQIDYALDEAFDWKIDYNTKQAIHNYVRTYLFPEFNSTNTSHGIYNQEKVGDATMAYEIYKVLNRYRSITNNDGWSDWGRSFDKPHSHTGIPLPEVQHFVDYKDFKVPKKLWRKIDKVNSMDEWKKEVWEDVWKSIDKAMPKLPKGEKSELIEGGFDGWKIRVTSPIRPKEEDLLKQAKELVKGVEVQCTKCGAIVEQLYDRQCEKCYDEEYSGCCGGGCRKD